MKMDANVKRLQKDLQETRAKLQNLEKENRELKEYLLQNSGKKIEKELEDKIIQELNEEYSAINEELKQSNEELKTVNDQLAEEINQRKKVESELLAYKKNLEKIVEERTRQLTISEQKYKLIIENIPSVVWKTNKKGETEYISKNVENVYGFTPEEIYSNGIEYWIDRIHPGDVAKVTEAFNNFVEKKGKFDVKYRIKHKNGKWIWLHDHADTVISEGNEVFAFGVFTDITRQMEFENTLQESEAKFRRIFESANDAIFVMKDENFIDCNQRTLEIFGCKREEIIGQPPYKFSPEQQPNGVSSVKAAREKIVAALHGNLAPFTWVHKRLDGTSFYAEVSLNSFTLQGELFLQAIVRDIDFRIRGELDLKNQQLFNQRISEQSPDIIYVYDVEKDQNIYINKELGTLLGYKKREMPENSVDLIRRTAHPDDLIMFEDYALKVKNWNNEYIKTFEYRLKDAQGDWRWFYGREKEFQREGNKITTLIGVVSDITGRKESEKRLKESEERYRMIFESSNDAIFLHSAEKGMPKNFTEVNSNACKLTGYTRGELLTMDPSGLDSPNWQEEAKPILKKLKNHGKALFERKLITKNGQKIDTEMNSRLFKYQGKNWVMSVARDITERKKAEQALQQSEEKFRNIFNNTRDAIVITNFKMEFIEVNTSFSKKLKYHKDEVLQLKTTDLVHPKHHQTLAQRLKEFQTGKKIPPAEIELLTREGKTIPVEISGRLINYLGTKAIITVIRDISERKEMDRRIFDAMLEAEEQERKRLAQDLHDDIGPLLSTLNMYIHAISEMREDNQRNQLIVKSKEIMHEAITNVRTISNDISPHILSNFGLESAIESRLEKNKDFIHVDFESNLDKKRFPTTYETIYYRIFNELINNTLKHASAKNVSITLQYSNNLLILEYKDDGKGFDIQNILKGKKAGLGIMNILSRASKIGGNYQFYSLKQGMAFHLSSEIKN